MCQETGAFSAAYHSQLRLHQCQLTNTRDAADLRSARTFRQQAACCVDVPSGRRFRVSDGIPNMLLAQDEA